MRKQQGFTLIELLITLAILGILSSVALPSFVDQLKHNRLVANTNQLQNVFQFARSEAAKRDKIVTIEESGGEWHVLIDGHIEPLKKFQASHESISVDNLQDIIISTSGEVLGANNEFLITDNDSTTVDFCLNILTSGQVQRTQTDVC